MFKAVVLLWLALHACIAGHAQASCTYSLAGRVTGVDGAPFPGAAIIVRPGNKGVTIDGNNRVTTDGYSGVTTGNNGKTTGNSGVTTDKDGRYRVVNLCPASYRIRIQFVGYQAIDTIVTVSDNVEFNAALEESVTELREVVVEHHDEDNTEHATHFVVLDERKLAESAGKSLGEVLKNVSGVSSLQTGPGIFKPVIHGVHSQRLLILNYGIRHEGQQWGVEHAPEIDPFIASNVVVIKDASAIRYGAGALGGVIVINPPALPETNKLGGSLTSVLQSNGRAGTLSGMIEGGVGKLKGWGWRLQGTARRTGDFHTPDYSLTNTGVSEMNFSAATGYHAENFGLDFFFSHFNSELGILRGTAIGNLDDLVAAMEREPPLYTTNFSYNIREPRQAVSHNLIKVNGHVNGKAGELRFQYGFQNNNRQEYDMRIGDLSKIPAIDLQLNTQTLDTEWETHHTEKSTFSVGVNLMYQVNNNVPGTQRIPFVPNFTNITGGLFAASQFTLEKWTLDAGVRYDYRNYDVKGFDFKNARYDASFDFNNVSAALGITRLMNDRESVKLNVSTSWRPPHVSELYSLGTHQSAAAIEYGLMLDPVTNEVRDVNEVQFSPEQAIKTVFSYGLQREGFQLTVAPYVNYILNYIYLRPEGITETLRGVYPYFRYHQTNALFTGADIDASVVLMKYLTVSPRISLLRARDLVNDDYFLFIPSNRYSIDLRCERAELFGLRHPYAEAGIQYVSKQYNTPRVVTVREIKEAKENDVDLFAEDDSIFDYTEAPDGYWLLRVSTGCSIKTKKVQYDFRLSAENLLDQRYREYTNRYRYYADDIGRNVSLSVKCIF